jgi:hypothetical protein
MIIGDVLLNFPQIRPFLEDLHPLGLMSPLLDQITIEMFFSDQEVDIENICQHITNLIAQSE